MRTIETLLAALALLAGVLAAAPARAETFNTCAGFIDSLPTVITTQGVWCLRKDLSTAITFGNAILIATNNVTIDCNNFKIGGLAAGDSSRAVGIYAGNRQNASVRHCAIRGFQTGIRLLGGAGHLVEDNRLDNNLYTGIRVSGDNNLVQRNRIYDTGGYPGFDVSYGIHAAADVIDNTVAGVFAAATTTNVIGIVLGGEGSVARGNRVRGLVDTRMGRVIGISVPSTASGVRLTGNHISAATSTNGLGIISVENLTFCIGNTTANIADSSIGTAYFGCSVSVDNLELYAR